MPLQATSGAASYDAFGGGAAAEPNYIESVFSTFLYTGNDSTQTITNGIDLAGEGGMVWTKMRSTSQNHRIWDTLRGANKSLQTNTTDASETNTNSLTSFNSDGFSLGDSAVVNYGAASDTYASWTFRKQPKFFDVVTYTGNGTSGRTIAHNLGSEPGCIIVKCTSEASAWAVYHRSAGASNWLRLNTTDASTSNSTIWNNTAPTSTVFTVGNAQATNQNTSTYVAYIFAHDAGGFGLTGTDNVISCGSYTGNGSADGPTINLGYEPQWLMVKCATSDGGSDPAQWWIIDNMRGWESSTFGTLNYLAANSSQAELERSRIELTSTGFKLRAQFVPWNGNGQTYIYIAIRRGPMKVPTTGTSVFAPALGQSGNPSYVTGFPVDFAMSEYRVNGANWTSSRLQGIGGMDTASTSSESDDGSTSWSWMNGHYIGGRTSQFISWAFRRAPGFFDVVCYTGTGSPLTLNHNLGVAPELIIYKSRSNAQYWLAQSSALPSVTDGYLLPNYDSAAGSISGLWRTPNTTTFGIALSGNLTGANTAGVTYVSYLFASCPGVSKVFSYTGNGSSQTINCGFTGGARFVMIKRTDSTGNWLVVDTARGLVSAGDPTLYLNSTAAEVTGVDWIDPDSSGFIVNQEGTMNANVSSATYIGLAIA